MMRLINFRKSKEWVDREKCAGALYISGEEYAKREAEQLTVEKLQSCIPDIAISVRQ